MSDSRSAVRQNDGTGDYWGLTLQSIAWVQHQQLGRPRCHTAGSAGGVSYMPNKALVTHGFGFSLGTRFIPTLGLGMLPAPPPIRGRLGFSFSSGGTMPDFVTPRPPRLDWAALIAASVPYATAEMHLYTNDITPSQDNVEADFVEADFGGYAAVGVTWDTPYIDGLGKVHLPADNIVFVSTGAPDNSVYGYYLIGAGGEFLGAARFDDAPRPVPSAGYGVDASVEVIV